MSKDYYKILGIDKNATDIEIKKAFSKLAHEHHPDKKSGDEAKFKEVNEAYQVLKDKEKRQRYDQFGSADGNPFSGGGNPFSGGGGASWQDFSQGFGGFQGGNTNFDFGDLGDIFGDMFGGSRSAGSRRKSKGSDLQTEINISFEEAVFGTEKTINLNKKITCDNCHGEGGTDTRTCSKCGGSGQVRIQQDTFFGTFQSVAQCPECGGAGKVIKNVCGRCNGSGYTKGTEQIKVKIPAGIDNNQTLKLSGKGEAGGKSRASGDLFIKIKVQKSNKFERFGYDIKSNLKLKYSQLIKGDKIDIDTVDGSIKLKIPPFTSSGKVFVLKDKGVYKLNSRGRGDHFITVKLDLPNSLTREQKKLIDDLEKNNL
ncbi:MAG: molecular chaperone DnaJ [Patescibacteria group bacterium]|nr:molecular chaperone DnaJ [Patescibacteria group bacterium]MDD4304687.1 molecular chaperone DnaJ [Patescibacteria group bacterium]MDD4695345.1 molecular chaperone DnaJ [Patescibacteria group bacterium]